MYVTHTCGSALCTRKRTPTKVKCIAYSRNGNIIIIYSKRKRKEKLRGTQCDPLYRTVNIQIQQIYVVNVLLIIISIFETLICLLCYGICTKEDGKRRPAVALQCERISRHN